MQRMRLTFAGFVLTSLLLGCASSKVIPLYEGEKKDDSQIAMLNIAPSYDIIELDGKEIKTDAISNTPRRYHLAPGSHRITLRYFDILDVDPFSVEKVTAKPISFALHASAGGRYSQHMPIINDIGEARLYADAPRFTITDDSNGALLVEVNAGKVVATATAVHTEESEPLAQLKQWWQKASNEERKQFKMWLIDQE